MTFVEGAKDGAIIGGGLGGPLGAAAGAVLGGAGAYYGTKGVIWMMGQAKDKIDSLSQSDTCPTGKCEKDPCAHLRCGSGTGKYIGGAHGCVGLRENKPDQQGRLYHSHHMPAKAVSPLPVNDGPAIMMDREDHYNTSSYGKPLTDTYMVALSRRISSGYFMGAVEMDIADVKAKFGNKYDSAIAQMSAYAECLKKNERVQ